MPQCSKCQLIKEEKDFAKNKTKKSGLQSYCRDCKKQSDVNYYLINKTEMRKQITRTKDKNRQIAYQKLFEYFTKNPCVDCKETDPLVLEFDHQSDKSIEVSKLVSNGYIWPTILKEIEKCQVRCANCHKRKTTKQFFKHKVKWCVARDSNPHLRN